jgi:hypothetical protein
LLQRWTNEDLNLEIAYQQIEPLPDSWLQTGIVAATVCNTSANPPKKAKSPADFIPQKPKTAKERAAELRKKLLNMFG